MSRQWGVAFLIFLCLAAGCSTFQGAGVSGQATPVVTESFASKEVFPGDTWKVYLKASDPDGEMTNIYAQIWQPGMMPYGVSIIRLKRENRKELSGYIYLSTSNPASPLNFVTLTLWVEVQDRSGNFSQPVGFPLSIDSRSTQQAPPRGVFKEEALGPVMINLKSGRSEME